jgi:hypothetical protein
MRADRNHQINDGFPAKARVVYVKSKFPQFGAIETFATRRGGLFMTLSGRSPNLPGAAINGPKPTFAE